MKSVLKNLSLLSIGLLIYSCNEKISPELQNGGIGNPVAPEEYFFKVTSTSPVVLNYVLHRTGPGNVSTGCKVNSIAGAALSSTLYIGDATAPHDSKSYDQSCFFETEELSLLFNGLSFKVEASKNTCDYVGYSPYSFFDHIPGATRATWRGLTCTEDISTAAAQGALTAQPFGVDVLGGASREIGCNEMVDTSIADVTKRLIIPVDTEEQDLCVFDYSPQDGEDHSLQNCDIGTMSYNLLNVYLADSGAVASKPEPKSPHACGGKIYACVEGPIRQISELEEATYGTEILNTEINKNFSKEYILPNLHGKNRVGNVDIVNYRRGLANNDLNFINYSTTNDSSWDSVYNKAFDPTLMEKYASNRTPENEPIIDWAADAIAGASVSNATYLDKTIELGYTAIPYAADPFLGLGARVNPFYTFYCFDRAMEIKARIRMVVRDWDKVYQGSSTELELISDVYKSVGSRRQDLPVNEEEIPNDPGAYNYFNDIYDWDTFVYMTRTDPNAINVYDPGDTFWSPTAGWWNPLIFPRQGPMEDAK